MPIVRLENVQQFAAINLLVDPGAIAGPKLVPSCAQIIINWSLTDGKVGKNVLYGRYTGAFAGSTAQATSIFTGLSSGGAWTAMAAQMAPTNLMTGIQIRNVAIADQALISSTGAAVPGTAATGALPDEMAICVTLRSALVGRANRGRMYLPGWATSTVAAGNIILAATVTAVGAWAATISSVLAAQGYVWVIGQPARNAYTGSTGAFHPARVATSTPITSTQVRDNHWDSQRRRGLK